MMGFLLALSGSFLSGARWTFSQLIMQKSAIGLEHPIDLIYHIQPLMILTLLPIAIGIEGTQYCYYGFKKKLSNAIIRNSHSILVLT